MRCSGVWWFHIWRVVPAKNEAGTTTFTIFIDGEDKGALMSTTIEGAVTEARLMVEEMIKAGQR